jgi:hypothetical protein
MKVLLVEPDYRRATNKRIADAARIASNRSAISFERQEAQRRVRDAERNLAEARHAAEDGGKRRMAERLAMARHKKEQYAAAKGSNAKRAVSRHFAELWGKLKDDHQNAVIHERQSCSRANQQLAVARSLKKTQLSRQLPPLIHDDKLWYPPLGLMKLAQYHKNRGDEVHFTRGCDPTIFREGNLFEPAALWDRIYITTLFTYHFDNIVKTINFYKDAVGGTVSKIYVGGIMASLIPDAIAEHTGIYPTPGVLVSSRQIGFDDEVNIDTLPPDYDILDPTLYAINSTYYTYTTRGCPNTCAWCGVSTIEPQFVPYIDIRPTINSLRLRYGDKPTLRCPSGEGAKSKKYFRLAGVEGKERMPGGQHPGFTAVGPR